ncbi:MAG: hypothetical protein ACYDGR_14765 [Candidatus Dormibacteria bacterium]
MPLSNTQADRLGERLRQRGLTESDLRSLDDYRRAFEPAQLEVTRLLKTLLGLHPTVRPAKTSDSILAKLLREPRMRLSQMQDIAGCRAVVLDLGSQDRTVDALRTLTLFGQVDDRRAKPSFGYRAVHVILVYAGKPVEVQVRTRAQHLWAEISERLARSVDPAIKYGGGPDSTRDQLLNFSRQVAEMEDLQARLILSPHRLQQAMAHDVRRIVEGGLADVLRELGETTEESTENS